MTPSHSKLASVAAAYVVMVVEKMGTHLFYARYLAGLGAADE
jgi:hypothetical protein